MFLLLSTSDTDLLSARASGADVPAGQPGPRSTSTTCPRCSTAPTSSSSGSSAAGGAWEERLDALLAGAGAGRRARRRAGARRRADGAVDRARSGVAAEAHAYLAHGGPDNLAAAAPLPVRHGAAHRHGFDAAGAERPTGGCWTARRRRAATGPDGRGPLLPGPPHGREHRVRRGALPTRSRRAGGRALPVFAASLRTAPSRAARRRCGAADALVATVLAAGGTRPADGVRPAATTRPGTSARSPPSTSRSCRGCA